MKKFTFLTLMLFAVIFFVSTNSLLAQALYFCEGVNDDGQAINSSTVFNIPDSGGYLYFLVKMDRKRINCKKVLYDIYRLDSRGKETFDHTIYQEVEPTWGWFWKKITFEDPGTYKIYVYDEAWEFVASSKIKISYK